MSGTCYAYILLSALCLSVMCFFQYHEGSQDDEESTSDSRSHRTDFTAVRSQDSGYQKGQAHYPTYNDLTLTDPIPCRLSTTFWRRNTLSAWTEPGTHSPMSHNRHNPHHLTTCPISPYLVHSLSSYLASLLELRCSIVHYHPDIPKSMLFSRFVGQNAVGSRLHRL